MPLELTNEPTIAIKTSRHSKTAHKGGTEQAYLGQVLQKNKCWKECNWGGSLQCYWIL